MFYGLIALWLLLFARQALALPRISVTGPRLYADGGDQFFVKGIDYSSYKSDWGADSFLDDFTNATQCAIDAPILKTLGANTIKLFALDPAKDHDACMKVFADNDIYVMIGFYDLFLDMKRQGWTINVFDKIKALIDEFQSYDNTLAFLLGEYIRADGESQNITLPLKAAVRDIKQYMTDRNYRPVAVGHYLSGVVTNTSEPLAHYLTCNSSQLPDQSVIQPDFLGLYVPISCSIEDRPYSSLIDRFGDVVIPLLVTDLCIPQKFNEEVVVFNLTYNDQLSGMIVRDWVFNNSRSLVEYPDNQTIAGTPTPKGPYTQLQSQWSAASPTGIPRALYDYIKTYPACPTTDEFWSIPANAVLPTATVASESAETSSSSYQASPSSSSLSTGAIAGVSVACVIVAIAILASSIWYCRKRRNNNNVQKVPAKVFYDTSRSASKGERDSSVSTEEVVEAVKLKE